MRVALFTIENQRYLPPHIEGRKQRGQEEQEELGPKAEGQRVGQNLVFAPEAGQGHHATQRRRANHICPEGRRHRRAEAAHLPHILGVVGAVNDRTGTEEEQRLKEAVGQQVEDRWHICAHSAGGDHKA